MFGHRGHSRGARDRRSDSGGLPSKATNLGNYALALADQAKTNERAEADRLFAAAYEKYEAALELDRSNANTLGNWGIALLDQARTKLGEEADQLFRDADEKLERAETNQSEVIVPSAERPSPAYR